MFQHLYIHIYIDPIYLQQRLRDLWVLGAVKVQHLGAQAVVVGPHLVQVHHRGVGVEHRPPAFAVHLGQLHGDHAALPLVQALRQPQRELHLGALL